MASLEGRQLGSYRIQSILGAGGMGEVYRAYDQKLQRDVAIKVLGAMSAGDPSAAARLLREARAAAALNHPNICAVHEVGEHEGQSFIAMELVEGESLHRVIPRGSGLPIEKVLDYGCQIADALAHAHDRGVLHRDLKASNVVIAAGRPKVLDFGLAKRFTSSEDAVTAAMTALTEPGTLAGTLAYMAPEQLRGRPADARSDVWALGALLYEMAAGELPFTGQTSYELSAAILNEAPRSLPERVPPNLQQVVSRCLEKDPAERYQKASEVLAALEAIRAGIQPLQMSQRRPKGRPRVRAAAILAALVLVSVAAIALNVGGVRDRFLKSQPLFDSIAVLPFENLSGDSNQEYIASGIQQALITDLSHLPDFTKVVSRGATRRFRTNQQAPAEMGRALDVRAVVTGSVLRSGDRVQIAAQLIDVASDRQVWGDSYERPFQDVVAMQNEIVADIARAIHLRLRPSDRERMARTATIKPETYEAYLRGMYEVNNDRQSGLKYLQEAIDKDPGDPFAYVGLAIGYAALGHGPAAPDDAWIRARAAAERALTLAPDLADAHAVMADVKLYYDRDWVGAERAFKRANELNPNLAMNHYHYAWYLALVDRLDEAIVEHERARDLDPLTPLHTGYLADLYRAAGRYEDAINAAKKSIENNPNAAVSWQALGFTYSDMGRHDEAIDALQRAIQTAPPWTFALGIMYARAGRIDEARQLLAKMQSRPVTSYNVWAMAQLHGVLGDRDDFFKLMDHKPQHAWIPWVRTEPALKLMWDDPRFAELMARFKLPLPKYAKTGQ